MESLRIQSLVPSVMDFDSRLNEVSTGWRKRLTVHGGKEGAFEWMSGPCEPPRNPRRMQSEPHSLNSQVKHSHTAGRVFKSDVSNGSMSSGEQQLGWDSMAQVVTFWRTRLELGYASQLWITRTWTWGPDEGRF